MCVLVLIGRHTCTHSSWIKNMVCESNDVYWCVCANWSAGADRQTTFVDYMHSSWRNWCLYICAAWVICAFMSHKLWILSFESQIHMFICSYLCIYVLYERHLPSETHTHSKHMNMTREQSWITCICVYTESERERDASGIRHPYTVYSYTPHTCM